MASENPTSYLNRETDSAVYFVHGWGDTGDLVHLRKEALGQERSNMPLVHRALGLTLLDQALNIINRQGNSPETESIRARFAIISPDI